MTFRSRRGKEPTGIGSPQETKVRLAGPKADLPSSVVVKFIEETGKLLALTVRAVTLMAIVLVIGFVITMALNPGWPWSLMAVPAQGSDPVPEDPTPTPLDATLP